MLRDQAILKKLERRKADLEDGRAEFIPVEKVFPFRIGSK